MIDSTLDPVLERLSGRHLPACEIWRTERVMDADLCECPPEAHADVREQMYADLAATLPLHAVSVARRIADVARFDPNGARATADGVVRQVLARIASGAVPEAAKDLAAAALVIAPRDNRGWYA